MKKYLVTAAIGVAMLFPAIASAQQLTMDQVNAVIGLLQAFGVDQATINEVYDEMTIPVPTAQDLFNVSVYGG